MTRPDLRRLTELPRLPKSLLLSLLALASGAWLLQGCSQLPSLEGVPGAETAQAVGRVAAAAMPISTEKEVEIGRTVAGTVAGREPLLLQEELTRYVELVGHVVAAQSVRRGEIAFRFGVLDSDEVNAYAAPGGYIFVTRGTLALLQSEAELAAVLAHEVAHVDARHVIEEIRKGDVIRTARDEAELSGAVLDRVAGMGSSLLFTGLSRRDELEADSLGVVYLAGAGYRADAFLDFLSRVKAAEGDPDTGGRLRELQATHPPSGDRIRALERIVSDLPAGSREGVDLQERYRDSVLPHL